MKTVQFDPDSWTFIYYTGKRELVLGARPDNPRLKVITGRPDLEALILGIIDNAESDIPMCPKLMQRAQASERSIYEKSTEQHFRDALERALVTYSYDEIFHLAINASAPVNGGPPPLVDLAGFIRMVRSVCKVEGEFGLTDVVLYSKVCEFDSSNARCLSCRSTTPGTSRKSPVLVVSDANFATSGDTTFDDGTVMMCTRLVQLVARNSYSSVITLLIPR